MINSLGLEVFAAQQQFALSRPGDLNTILVSVCDDDGLGNAVDCEIIPRNASNGWSFDANLNSVTLHGTSIPGPTQHVVIEYLAICF